MKTQTFINLSWFISLTNKMNKKELKMIMERILDVLDGLAFGVVGFGAFFASVIALTYALSLVPNKTFALFICFYMISTAYLVIKYILK